MEITSLHPGADYLASARAYASQVELALHEAVNTGAAKLQESLRHAAARNERWKGLDENITVQVTPTGFEVSVDPGAASEAMAAEFGDADHPPAPMIRAGLQHADPVGESVRAVLQHRLGNPGL